MSHCLGVICALHRSVMESDTWCPERHCPGGHGYAVQPCDPRCQSYRDNECVYCGARALRGEDGRVIDWLVVFDMDFEGHDHLLPDGTVHL